jgi:hypothetical protein
MKAWKLYDFNDIRLEEVPMPEVRDGWVLVQLRVFQPSEPKSCALTVSVLKDLKR